MKVSGIIIRIVAIITLLLMFGVVIGNFALSAAELEDNREELIEDYEEHEDRHKEDRDYYGSEDDCDTCESYEDRLDYYDRYSIQLVLNAAHNALTCVIYSAILYAIGIVISGIAKAKAPVMSSAPVQSLAPAQPAVPVTPAAPVVPVAPAISSDVCATCGSKILPGTRFCASCGTAVEL